MKSSRSTIKEGLLCLFVGLIFIFVGVINYRANKVFFETAESDTAVVEKIKKKYKRNTIFESGSVYISYSVNGTTYTDVLRGYDTRHVDEGDWITIYYQEDNPKKIKTEEDEFKLVILFAVLAIFLFDICFAKLFDAFAIRERMLKKHGVCYNAIVTNVVLKQPASKNGKTRYYVECQATNPNTLQLMSFRSDNVYQDLSNYQLITVPVYVSKRKTKKYYVDLESVIEVQKFAEK